MKYKIILFDADDTLFDFHRSEKHAFEQTVRAFGIPYDESFHLKAYREVNAAIWKEFEDGRIAQSVLKVERFRRFADLLHEGFNPADFARSYEENLGNACFLFDGSIELVECLHREYRLAIVTNGLKSVQENRIGNAPIAWCFETIVISESAGVSKPDPRIFEIALRNLGHSVKNTVLMVGDSLTTDIRGGIGFGIDTCWYNPSGKDNNTGIRPTYEIAVLADLVKILG
jgi:2-haloacid dehalogenase